MEQTLVETEKFKAAIEKPPGRLEIDNISPNIFLSEEREHITQMNPIGQAGNNVCRTMDSSSGAGVENDSMNSMTVRQVIGGTGISDDDFFHLTCHIDPSLNRKIKNGEFVDLDKLLPKDNNAQGRFTTTSNETRLEWVQSEGSIYLVPAKQSSRINCFRRWEQAFRMYATVYCTKHPNRAREIWQYIYL